MITPTPAFLQEIEDSSVAQCVPLIRDVARSFVDPNTKLVYGEKPLPPSEVILKMHDDMKAGRMAVLMEIEPKEFERRISEYLKAVKRLNDGA